jgi:hypothetical protein
VLYEEDPSDPQGKRYVGSAIWRTETVSTGSEIAPEVAVRADAEIPERGMIVRWSLRRNTDKALSASYTIETMFKLSADFPGGIVDVPGILMKQAEQARGTELAGRAIKVTEGFFLIGLSAGDTDVQRNEQLLKDRPWFDIPIVYTDGGGALLAWKGVTPVPVRSPRHLPSGKKKKLQGRNDTRCGVPDYRRRRRRATNWQYGTRVINWHSFLQVVCQPVHPCDMCSTGAR